MGNTDIQVFYNYWCDGSCYHTSKTENWMGMGIYSIETNTIFPMPIPRKLAVAGNRGTHNDAEYLAILCALTDLYIIEGAFRTENGAVLEQRYATIHSDSQLVIRQIIGQYQAKKKSMKLFLEEVKYMITLLNNMGITITFKWNPRDTPNQKKADRLSKIANPHFKDYEADDTIAHGIVELESILLPRCFDALRRGLKWKNDGDTDP